MKITLTKITTNAEKHIETCGRVCYQSVPSNNYKTGGLIKALIKSGHESVLEHAIATFNIDGISRACSHQLVRHRLASYSQKSQRYVKESQFEYVIPPEILKKESQIRNQYVLHMQQIQDMYNYWKEIGIKNEDARMVLPNACTTEIVMSTNFREWRKIIELRCDSHAQWEIRLLCNKILTILYNKCPNVFEDQYNKFIKKN